MIAVIEIRLQELVKAKGYQALSYRKLAAMIGISHLPLYKMIKGEAYNPSLEMIDKLCRFFKCAPGDFLKHRK